MSDGHQQENARAVNNRDQRPAPNSRASAQEGSGKCDSDQARAKQDKTSNCHREEAVGSEFVMHGTPPMSRAAARKERLSRCTVKKIFLPDASLGPGDDFMQHWKVRTVVSRRGKEL
jgi:hypothetical protein